jgi:PST family polysaccharide transporter
VLVVLSQGVQLATQICSLVVLSHLLAPRAFGVVAMVAAVIGLAGVLGSFGLSLSALAGKTPSPEERSNLFWVNAISGVTVTAVVVACGPLLADFYHVHALTGVTAGLALPFLLGAVGVQFRVEMTLAGQWTRLAVVQGLPGVIALPAAAVVAASTGSYWALVLQAVLASVLQLALAIVLSDWRPRAPHRATDVRHHVRFGRDTAAIQTLSYAASNADNIFIGRSLGGTALGQYNRAYNLASLPTSQLAIPLEQVILPRLSRSLDGDFDATLIRCQRVMVYALTVPLSVVAGVAYPLVHIFLGSHWIQVPELIQIQAAGQVFSAIGYMYYWSFLVKRRTGVMVFGEGLVEIALVLVIALVAKDGNAVVAWCVAAGQMCMTLASATIASRVLKLDVLGLFRVAVIPVLTLVVAAVGADAVATAGWPSPVLALVASGVSWIAISAAGYTLLPPVRSDLRLLGGLLRAAWEGPSPD